MQMWPLFQVHRTKQAWSNFELCVVGVSDPLLTRFEVYKKWFPHTQHCLKAHTTLHSYRMVGKERPEREEKHNSLLNNETLLDDVLIPMNAVMAGQRVLFESEAYAFDIPSSDHVREKRRKTRTIAGNFQLPSLSPGLLNPLRNPLWWQFISHKMLRLAAPLLLVIALITNWLIVDQHPFFVITLIGQLAAHGAVLLSHMFEGLRSFMPIRVLRAFHDMMYFTVLGAWTFLRGRQLSSWK